MFGSNLKDSERIVREVIERIVKDAMGEATNALRLSGELTKLRGDLETLRIEKARKDEEFRRKEREIEHKVGLERKRQEFEIEQAKRETSVVVREENLKADRSRFEEQLKFHEERFAAEVGYLKDMLSQLLPSTEIKIARRA